MTTATETIWPALTPRNAVGAALDILNPATQVEGSFDGDDAVLRIDGLRINVSGLYATRQQQAAFLRRFADAADLLAAEVTAP